MQEKRQENMPVASNSSPMEDTQNNMFQNETPQDLIPVSDESSSEEESDLESNTNSFNGSLYGSSSNNIMSSFMRHPNFTKRIKNLFFCGGSVHPGGGIPLAILSSKIVSDLIESK